MLLLLILLLFQVLCVNALARKDGGFLLLQVNLLRFFFDLDLLCCSFPPLSLLLQFFWSWNKREQVKTKKTPPVLTFL